MTVYIAEYQLPERCYVVDDFIRTARGKVNWESESESGLVMPQILTLVMILAEQSA